MSAEFCGLRHAYMQFNVRVLDSVAFGRRVFTTSAIENRYFALTTTAILAVAGIEYFDCMGTMWRAKIRMRVSNLFALGFLALFLIGGLTGIFVASPPRTCQSADAARASEREARRSC